MIKIPVYRPSLCGNEKKFVVECLDSTWISSKGKFIDQFESSFAHFVQAPHAVAVCNGTVAIHLALVVLGIGPGDEVIVPSLTYIASVNAIAYTGAEPVFADSLEKTWQMDPEDVRRKITPKTKAILAVHLYGHPCGIEELKKIADSNQLYLIEDCAEALGAYYKDQHVGTFGSVGTFSFFGNKTITTGEGGMLVMQDSSLHQKASILKGQGNDPGRTYWHSVIGYNYRMTNLAAAIGVAQLEYARQILQKKREIAEHYRSLLTGLPVAIHSEEPGYTHSYWMVSILVERESDRDALRAFLEKQGVETRPFFYPTHFMPMYRAIASGNTCKTAEKISARGINLPSFPELTTKEIEFICHRIRHYFAFTAAAGTQKASLTFA